MVGHARAGRICSQTHHGTLADREHVLILVIGRAQTRSCKSSTAEFDGARCANERVRLGVRRALGPDFHAVGRGDAHVTSHRNAGLVLGEIRLFACNHEPAARRVNYRS